MIGKKVLVIVLALTFFCAAPPRLPAAEYPAKPIQLIIPYAPGGITDILGRLVAEKSKEALGQPMVVLNKPGAGGALGMDFVAKAKPDGHTLAVGAISTLAILKAINPRLSYDPVKDTTPICRLDSNPNVILVRADSPLHTLEKLVDYARKNPGKLNFGTSGVGTSLHFSGELLQRAADIRMVHVPHKGAAPSLMALLGGHIELVFSNITEAVEQIKSGKVIPLAVTYEKRYSELPNVPSVAEKGYPGAVMAPWLGIAGPAGLPVPIVDKLAGYFQKVVESREVEKKLKELGMTKAYLPPAEFAKFVRSEVAKYTEVARKANIVVE